jgi:hypothetical protein
MSAECEATPVSSRIWLRVVPRLPSSDLENLLLGLQRVAGEIERVTPGEGVLVEVLAVDYKPTDYQTEAMTIAMIGWAAEYFDLPEPGVEVDFDKQANRYVFRYPPPAHNTQSLPR